MKNIHIKINEFGPLKNVEVDFAPFVLLTGESGLGKSYVNYLFYYVMVSFTDEELYEYCEYKITSEVQGHKIKCNVEEFSTLLDSNVTFFMQKLLGDESLICDVNFFIGNEDDPPLTLVYSEIEEDIVRNTSPFSSEKRRYNVLFVDDDKFIVDGSKFIEVRDSPEERDILLSHMSNFIRYWIGCTLSPYLLPPSRGALVGESYSVKAKVSSAMGMYDEFLRQYDRIVIPGKKSDNEQYEDYLKLMSDLIGGTLQTENGRQYLVLNNENRVSLTAAAASVKEISPLLFAIKNNFDQKSTFCFEEPEAHLHPKMQIKVADLVAAFSNKGNLFHITTHSDYFLNRINQLIKLNDVKEKSEEQFETLCQQLNIPKMSALDRKKIKAYFFKRENGEVKVHLLDISKNGIPLSTFFDTVNNVGNTDDEIDNVLYNLEK